MPPKLTLFIPQLTQPLKTWHQDFGFEPETPVLSSLFRAFRRHKTDGSGLERSLFSDLGLSDKDELPMARYRFLAHQNHSASTSATTEPDTMLVCADPVHCEVGMKDISLTQTIDDLGREESLELMTTLNQHFSEDGLCFLLDDDLHWYVSLPQQEHFQSTVTKDVIGKNIFSYLPRSETRNWQKIQNEVQMLLHLSSLNQTREMAGLPSVNSLWFWGGGAGFDPDNTFNTVFGGESIGRSIAKAAACNWKVLPEQGRDIVEFVVNSKNSALDNTFNTGLDTIVILEQLVKPALVNDIHSWQQQVNSIEDRYIKPLMQAWDNGEIELTIDTCNGQKITPMQPSAWKFWKKKAGVSLLTLA